MSPLLVFVQLLLVSMAMGLLLLRSPRLLRLPSFTRALTGLTLTPFVIAGFTMFLSGIWPQAPGTAYMLLPVGALWMLWTSRNAATSLARRSRRRWRGLLRHWEVSVARTGTFLCIILVCWVGLYNAFQPVVGHDALIYLNEAREFAGHRSLWQIPGFTGEPGEVISSHPHTFFYQAYLANAFIIGTNDPSPSTDLGPRLASQSCILFLLAGVLALGSVVRRAGVASLVLMAVLSVPAFGYLTHHDSRDAFRIAAVLLLVISLLPLTKDRKDAGIQGYLLPLVASMTAVAAHTLNILFTALVGLSMFALYSTRDISTRTLVKTGAAVAIGTLLPASHYLNSWLESGSVLGHGMYYLFYQGTPLWTAFEIQSNWNQDNTGLLGALDVYAARYGSILTVAGLAAALTIIFRSQLRRSRLVAWFAVFGLLIPLAPLGDSTGVDIRQAMLANIRYPLVVYPFLAMALVTVSLHFIDLFGAQSTQRIRTDRLLFLGMAAVAFASAVHSLDQWTRRSWASSYVQENYLQLKSFLKENLPAEDTWATDLYAAAYYAERQPIFLFSKQGSELFRTQDSKRIRELLRKNRIGMVALRNDIDVWWRDTIFLKTLEAESNEHTVRIGFWTVYLL